MRARVASSLVLAFAAPILASVACAGVPDLTFASGGDDAAAPTQPTIDSSTNPGSPGADDAASGQSVPDEGIIPIPLPEDDAGTQTGDAAPPPPPPTDAAPPMTGCPSSKPPPGVTCCGAVACKGNQQQCNCSECAYCANEGFCCPSDFPPPGYCANTLSACK